MSHLTQNIIIAVFVLGAVAYLARVTWRTFASKKGGNCCGGKSCAKMDAMNRNLENAGKGRRVKL